MCGAIKWTNTTLVIQQYCDIFCITKCNEASTMNFNKVSHLLLSTTFISFELVASQKHHNIHLIVYGEWNETCHLLYIHTSAMLCNSSVKMICDYIFFLFILLSNWDVQLWLAHGLHRCSCYLPLFATVCTALIHSFLSSLVAACRK